MELTAAERKLANTLGFDFGVCEKVKDITRGTLEQLRGLDEEQDKERDLPGLSVSIKTADVQSLIDALQPELSARGYRAFWNTRHSPDGLREGEEIVVLRTNDSLDIVRLKLTDGANYDIFTADIIARLQEWATHCRFEVIGAAHDWVALQFETLPDDLCAFAAEIYDFCPDTIEQGIGLMAEEDDPELWTLAQKICPLSGPLTQGEEAGEKGKPSPTELIKQHFKDSPTDVHQQQASEVESFLAEHGLSLETLTAMTADDPSTEMSISLLAASLHRDKYLFLWWD